MKDIKDVLEYVLKNKYVIMCVAIVVLLYVLGIMEFLTKFLILIVLVAIAIYIGKKMQDNEAVLAKFFRFKNFGNDDNVYYYQDKTEKNKDKESK